MNILDENIIENERQKLSAWGIRFRQVGYETGRKGMKDRNDIIPLLHKLGRSTFFTRDLGLYDRVLCHPNYCIVCLAVGEFEAAEYTRRFLNLSQFKTRVKRMGSIVRMSSKRIRFWKIGESKETKLEWPK